jgi:hypothetical protein
MKKNNKRKEQNNPRTQLQLLRKSLNEALIDRAQEIVDAANELFKSLPIDQDVEQSKTASVFTAIVDANGSFKAQINKLEKLGNGSRSPEIIAAITVIENMSQEASRFAAKVSGLTLS